MTPRSKSKLMIFIGSIIVIVSFLLSSCAEQQESNQTYKNRNTINAAIRVPDLNFSTRRLVLAKYYLVLERQRLNTCTYFAGRGSYGEAMMPTFGPSVNLSNQMTSPGMSEPDSVYVGQNDQTLVVLRNGNFTTVEADVTTTGGECPAEFLLGGARHIESPMQYMLETAAGIAPEFDFTNTDGLPQ